MKLYLMRHGEAVGPEVSMQRPLTASGIQQVQRLANFLHQANVKVEQVYQSGKLRAEQTAEILAGVMTPEQSLQLMPMLDQGDAVPRIADEISSWSEDTLLVGHIPVLPRLVSYLLIHNQDKFIVDFSPATMVCLERLDLVRWYMSWMIKPGLFK